MQYFNRIVCFHCEYLRSQKYEKGVSKIAPKQNCPPVRFRVWLGVRVRISVEGSFLREREIVLEPTKMLFFKQNHPFKETQFCKVDVGTLKH